jgi:hypothetical protein
LARQRRAGQSDRRLYEGIRLNPSQASLFVFRASAWQENHDFDKALGDVNEAFASIPMWPKFSRFADQFGNKSEIIPGRSLISMKQYGKG